MIALSALLILLQLASGPERPPFDWGARPAAVVAAPPAQTPAEAFVREVHVASAGDVVVVRFTFDRSVRDAMHLASGAPVSGRLRAVLYWDVDEDTGTGLDLGRADLRTGAERKLEIGVMSLGEDAEEKLPAQAVVLAALYGLASDSLSEVLWRTDDQTPPASLVWRGEWVEVRVPAHALGGGRQGRLVLAQLGSASVGRAAP